MKSKLFSEIKIDTVKNVLTGNQLFDEWFSKDGGIVPGSIIFVTGTSGAGKTTLMVNLMNWLKGLKSSFYSREMSISSLKHQIKDYEFNNNNAFFIDDQDCPNFNDYLNELDIIKPEIVVVDSLQAIAISDFSEMGEEKGSIYVREKLTQWCKDNNATLFLIGHNTKDNDFAGRNTNMQMVDAHMVLEYDKKNDTRILYWGKKNRKGPMGQLFYEIRDGEVMFHKTNPNINSDELSFSYEFECFMKNFIEKLDKNDEKTKELKRDLNQVSNMVYKKFSEDQNDYVTNVIPEFYKVLSKYGYN